jgi:hypothetical protein
MTFVRPAASLCGSRMRNFFFSGCAVFWEAALAAGAQGRCLGGLVTMLRASRTARYPSPVPVTR